MERDKYNGRAFVDYDWAFSSRHGVRLLTPTDTHMATAFGTGWKFGPRLVLPILGHIYSI